MTRLFLLPSFLLAFCLAQDSGLYINKVTIRGRYNDAKKYTYFVDDNYEAIQTSDFKNDAPSIGRLYEDDYQPDQTTCTVVECPKLRKLWSYIDTSNGKVNTSRIVDEETRKAMGVTGGKSMGFVAPYPGYCNSDDTLPVIELYSAVDNKYAYWSPANPNEFVNMSTTTLDTSRYSPRRLVGYALSQSPARLILEGKTPDFQTSIKNYTHSFHPAIMMVELVKDGRSAFSGKVVDIENLMAKGFTFKSNLFYLIAPYTGPNGAAIDTLCSNNKMLTIWSFERSDGQGSFRLYNNDEATMAMSIGYKTVAFHGKSFSRDTPSICGGMKGYGKIIEFEHKTQVNTFTYAVHPEKIAELLAGPWTKVDNRNLGYVSLDTIGFMYFKATVPFVMPFLQ